MDSARRLAVHRRHSRRRQRDGPRRAARRRVERRRQTRVRPRRARQPHPRFFALRLRRRRSRIPDVPVRVTVAPADGDDGPRIQAAIDQVAGLPLGDGRLPRRGPARAGPIRNRRPTATSPPRASSCAAPEPAKAARRSSPPARTAARWCASPASTTASSTVPKQLRVVDDYVPVGADKLRLDSTAGLERRRCSPRHPPQHARVDQDAGDGRVRRRLEAGHARHPLGPHRHGHRRQHDHARRADHHGHRKAIRRRDGRSRTIGRAGSSTSASKTCDWNRPHVDRQSAATKTMPGSASRWRMPKTPGSAASSSAISPAGRSRSGKRTKWVTVEDCISLAPISEFGGYRRHTFFTQGQLTLFLRCWSEHGRHDFAVGHCAPGPNAFVNCFAAEALGDSGPLESWASGVLYDNVRIDGAGLDLENRWIIPPGAGWSAANCVLWQCQAATIALLPPADRQQLGHRLLGRLFGRRHVPSPQRLRQADQPVSGPTPRARRRRDGRQTSSRSSVEPDRLDESDARRSGRVRGAIATAGAAIDRRDPRAHCKRGRGSMSTEAQPVDEATSRTRDPTPSHGQAARRSKTAGSSSTAKLITGGGFEPGLLARHDSARRSAAVRPGDHAVRSRPRRHRIHRRPRRKLADKMVADGVAVFDHHYGLWYDRRRDDHTMVRQDEWRRRPAVLRTAVRPHRQHCRHRPGTASANTTSRSSIRGTGTGSTISPGSATSAASCSSIRTTSSTTFSKPAPTGPTARGGRRTT